MLAEARAKSVGYWLEAEPWLSGHNTTSNVYEGYTLDKIKRQCHVIMNDIQNAALTATLVIWMHLDDLSWSPTRV